MDFLAVLSTGGSGSLLGGFLVRGMTGPTEPAHHAR